MKQFVSRHWRILATGFIIAGIGLLLFLVVFKESPIKEQLRVNEDKWKAQNVNNYRIRVQTTYMVGTDIYEVVVRDGQVSERICIQRCMVDKEGYTIPKIFLTIRDALSNVKEPFGCYENTLERCMELKYDAKYGYPTYFNFNPGCCDRGFVITVLSFEVLK
jgi:hypothetical protein